MKHLYQCDKCGKTWDEYYQATGCENSHLDLNPWSIRDELGDLIVYKEGSNVPSEFVVRTEEGEVRNNETGEWEKVPAKYVRYVLKSILNKSDSEALAKALLDKQEKARIENERWQREYRERQEAKKAAEEAAQEAAAAAIQTNEEAPAV